MPQLCRICNHADREAIDAELSRDWERSLRSMGQAYGVSKDSLLRHSQVHLRIVEDQELTDEARQVAEVAAHEKSEEVRRIAEQEKDAAEIGAEDVAPADEARQGSEYSEHEKSEPTPVPEYKPLSELDRVLAMFATRQSASTR